MQKALVEPNATVNAFPHPVGCKKSSPLPLPPYLDAIAAHLENTVAQRVGFQAHIISRIEFDPARARFLR